MREAVDALGYEGPIEVEIFNEALWATLEDKVLTLTKERYIGHVSLDMRLNIGVPGEQRALLAPKFSTDLA